MDFTFTETQTDAGSLARTVFEGECTQERLKAAETGADRFDRRLWATLAESGLLGLCLPDDLGGAGLDVLEMCTVLVEAGRLVAPVPLATHLPAAMALARFGGPRHHDLLDPATAPVLAAAVAEELDHSPALPSTAAERDPQGWRISGTKVIVPAGTVAAAYLVPARTAEGVRAFVVRAGTAGLRVEPQRLSDGSLAARLEFDGVAVAVEDDLGTEATTWLNQRLTLAACAWQSGVIKGALDLTAEYARTREQFGRPIGTFQAVAQRLADGYIDVLGTDLMLWQAAWRVAEGLPAEVELASAKLWAADAGHRLAHTTVHVHGGVGIDMDGPAHRFFTGGKLGEFLHGGGTDQARRIGAVLAAEPA